MERDLALWFCRKLIKNEIIDKSLAEIYTYGFEILLSFLTSTFVIIAVGLILHRIISTLTFLIVFILVRRFTGGFHASTYLKCKIFTVSVYLIVIFLSSFCNINSWMFLILGATGLCVICRLGPIENSNKPLTDKEKIKYRHISIILFETMTMLGYIAAYINSEFSNTVFYTLLSIIILMLYAILDEKEANL